MSYACVDSGFHLLQAFAKTWEKVQVELHGSYSLQRVRDFYQYSSHFSWSKLLFWCIWTPMPCLAYNILLDLAPLAKPSEGRDANYVFWIRCVFIVFSYTYGIASQLGHLVPTLGVTITNTITTSVVVALVCTGYGYIFAGFVPLPLPFVFVTASPAFLVASVGMFTLLFGRRLLRDSRLRVSVFQAVIIVNYQLGLTLTYPIYIYGFKSIPSTYKTPYLIVLPIIKIVAKNGLSKLVGEMNDLKPEMIIFNVDMYHSLYVSLAMQNVRGVSTSLVVMIIDVAQACVSVYDVLNAFQPLKQQMATFRRDHPLYGKNFLEVAMTLDKEEGPNHKIPNTRRRGLHLYRRVMPSSSHPRLKIPMSKKVIVMPARPDCGASLDEPEVSAPMAIRSSDIDAKSFLLGTRRLLFMVEFIILTEYTEVVVPVFYSAFMAAINQLPNRQFYVMIANIDVGSTVISILEYACLELLSFLALSMILYRIIGLSPMRQVGFALERQNAMIQYQFFTGMLCALQNTLQHLGADFSFKFAWLHTNHV